ncbi:MAG: GntR family transcriptional regulator [Rhodobacteraceae bacterium]|nr:GntR family transcriptional regulator [Paracoccaceae bacterium]
MTSAATTVGSSVYLKIKSDIITGALKPGKKLKLDTLKVQYLASVSTLRETLNRLASDGFVEAPEQRGFLVRTMSNEDLIELSNLRVLLECAALKASLAFGDEEWEGNLVSAHHKLAMIGKKIIAGEGVPPERQLHYDWEFHFALERACNSRHMISVFQHIYEKYIGYQLVLRNYRWAKALEEQQMIFEAALARDSEAATELLKSHLRKSLSFSLAAS